LNLALAGDMEIGEAADIATNISTPFKIAAEDLGRVNDVLAKAANSSNTNVHMMGEAFKYVAPVASATGQSIEEMASAMAILANNGIRADMAGTSLRMILLKLINSDIQKKISQYGVAIKDVHGNLRPILDILLDLNKATSNLDPTDQASIFEEIFESRAASSAIAVIRSTEAVEEFRDKMAKAKGTADEMAKTMANNLRGDWIAFKSAVEGVQIAIGEAVNDLSRDFLQRLTDLTRALVVIITNNRELIAALAAMGLRALIAGASIFSLCIGFRMLLGIAISLWRPLLTILGMFLRLAPIVFGTLTPIGMLRAAIIQTVAAMTYFSGAGSQLLTWAANIGSGLSNSFNSAFGDIIALFNDGRTVDAAKLLWLKIQLIFEQGRLYVTNQMNEMVAAFYEPFSAFYDFFVQIWQGIGDATMQVVNFIGNTWGAELNWLGELLGSWWSWILAGWDALQNDLGAVIVGGWWSIASGMNTALSAIQTWWNDLITGIQETFLVVVRAIVRQFAWAYAQIRGMNPDDVMNEWTAGLTDMIAGVELRSQNRTAEIEAGRQQAQQLLDDAATRSMERVDQARANAPKTNERIENIRLQIEELKKPLANETTLDTETKEKNKEIENIAATLGDYDTSKTGKGGKNELSGTFSAFEMGNVTGNLIEDVLNKQLKLQQETNRLLKQIFEEGGVTVV
jgi:TP901 family phage tail tape measure protein